MMLAGGESTSGQEMADLVKALKAIDDFLIIPAAMGSLITGFLISYTTQWGVFRFHWVTVKWVLTVALILSGAFLLGPWVNGMEEVARENPASLLSNADFLRNHSMASVIGAIQTATLVLLVFVSVFNRGESAVDLSIWGFSLTALSCRAGG